MVFGKFLEANLSCRVLVASGPGLMKRFLRSRRLNSVSVGKRTQITDLIVADTDSQENWKDPEIEVYPPCKVETKTI